ncbi:MAG: 50S ribosomal protein L28, partial [bacterium]|nr:50S ribosomal protein L28 [bacterium]
PNLSTRTVKDGNNTKKVSVCTSCIKAGKVFSI